MRPPSSHPAHLSRRCAMAALASAASFGWAQGPCGAADYPLGLTSKGTLMGCPSLSATESGCVTSMPNASPNRYVAPLRYDGEKLTRDAAFKRVRAYLASDSEASLDPQSTPEYLHATLTDQRSGGASDLELRFLDGEPLISVRLLARNPTTTQPVCLQRGCINGNNAERQRLERLRVDNGFESEDDRYQVEKDWVPVFFH